MKKRAASGTHIRRETRIPVILGLACVLVVSWFAVQQITVPGFFRVHDDTQAARVAEMGRALRDGQFPVRWVENLGYGYGYPIFNFYGPLPYYLGGFLYASGVPVLEATKFMYAAGVILSGIAMYAVLYSYTGAAGAVTGAALYLMAPYRAVQVYVRGAVGEYYVLIFWPVIVHAVLLTKSDLHRKTGIVLGSVALAGAVVSHTLMGYATAVILGTGVLLYGVYRFSRTGKPGGAPAFLLMIALGLMMSAFFWLPAVAEMGYTAVSTQVSSTADFRNHFVCPVQLWSSTWGFGGSAPGCDHDGLSFMLGKLHILTAVTGGILWAIGRFTRITKGLLITSFALFITGIFLTLEWSLPLWGVIPGFAYIQYPWRFLSVAGLGIAMLGSFVVMPFPKGLVRVSAAALIVISVVWLNAGRFRPQYIYDADSLMLEDVSDIRQRVSRISDEYLPPDIIRPDDVSGAFFDRPPAETQVSVSEIVSSSQVYQYAAETAVPARIRILTAYFPGFTYTVNGESVEPSIRGGFPEFDVPAGQSVITLRFTDTPVRTAANTMSVMAVLIVSFIYVRSRQTRS